MVEIYLLEQLIAFKEHHTLSDAAKALHLTQPTLTRSMRKLEELFGVPLFIHEKKRLHLNENGLLAADYAMNILQLENQMLTQVRMHEKSKHTVTIGSCAPGPLMELMPLLTNNFPHMTVSTELQNETMLLRGLDENTYQMIILDHPVAQEIYYCQKCGSEQLCVSFVPEHRLSRERSLSFHDMDGERFLMASEVGIWDNIVRKMMPSSKFLLQDDIDSLTEIANTSSLPCFSTDVTQRIFGGRSGRISIPFSDPEAHVDFYCICLSDNRKKYQNWFQTIRDRAGL